MKHSSIVVRADWDDEAKVWVATSEDVDGLCIEADTIEALKPRVAATIGDLLPLNGVRYSTAEPVHVSTDGGLSKAF